MTCLSLLRNDEHLHEFINPTIISVIKCHHFDAWTNETMQSEWIISEATRIREVCTSNNAPKVILREPVHYSSLNFDELD